MRRNQANIKVVCRRCGEKADSNEFKVDFDLGVMVCPNCISNKPRPKKNYFKEDEEFDVFQGYKKKTVTSLKKIEGKDFITYTCKKCSFPFKFNLKKQYPHECPYCGQNIPQITMFKP